MHFEKDFTYHVYNRSNETIFKTRDNYLYFLKKFRKFIFPYTNVLSWCLMPNHFHFMITPNKKATDYVSEKHLPNTQILSKQIGTFISSYAKAFNKQNNRIGSLFAHNTKAKQLNYKNNNYSEICFRYIHYNPVKDSLVKNIKDWKFSSYNDFEGLRNGTLINKTLAMQTVNYDDNNFKAWSLIEFNDDDLRNIF